MVRVSRGVAPWESGSTSVLCSRRQASTRASSIRAPWSRRSRSPSSSGCGAASGIRVALIIAASSVEHRPLIQAPPAWSSVIAQVSTQVGGAFEPVEGSFVAAFVAVGVDHGDEVQRDLLQLGGVELLGVGEQHLHPAGSDVGVAGQPVDRALDDLGLGRREPAVPQRLGHWRQTAARPSLRPAAPAAGPVPLWPPQVWVRKSWVEAHPAVLTASVASSSRTTPRASASSVDLRASTSADHVHQLVAVVCRPQRVDHLGHPCRMSASSLTRLLEGCDIPESNQRPLTVSDREFPCVEGETRNLCDFDRVVSRRSLALAPQPPNNSDVRAEPSPRPPQPQRSSGTAVRRTKASGTPARPEQRTFRPHSSVN